MTRSEEVGDGTMQPHLGVEGGPGFLSQGVGRVTRVSFRRSGTKSCTVLLQRKL